MFCSVGGITASVNGKVVYNHELVMKAEGKAPTPVAQFISNDHHDYEIAHWLARLTERNKTVTGSKSLPFQIVVMDI